jgi:hypothetical protein
MKYTSLFILALLCLASCLKPNDFVKKNLSGTIIDSVTNKPFANTNFKLEIFGKERSLLGKQRSDEHSITTNENGYFTIEFDAYTNSELDIVNPISSYNIWSYNIGRSEEKNINAGTIKTTIYIKTKVTGTLLDSATGEPMKNTAFWFTEERKDSATGQSEFNRYPFYTDDFGAFSLEAMLKSDARIGICYPDKPQQAGGRDFWSHNGFKGAEIKIGTLKVPKL